MSTIDAVRRLTALALVVVLALAAVACTKPPAPEGGAGSETAATSAPAATAETGAKAEGAVATGDAAAGQEAFSKVCVSCHGPDAKGMEGLGKNLHANQFVADNTDAELVAFLKVGRPAADPLNTTKVDMPPKGGNPAYTDEDLANIVAYLRTLK